MTRRAIPTRHASLLLLLIPILLAGCRGGLCDLLDGDSVRIDGVTLKHRRDVELSATDLSHLEIESHRGDITLRGVSGGDARLEVEIYEYRPGDATARLGRDGRILLETESGKPAAVGEVRGEIPQSLSLELATGMGGIALSEMRDCAEIAVSSGMGDISISDCAMFEDLAASTGMGDLDLDGARSFDRAELSTGMGGIRVVQSEVQRLVVSSGMGSIKLRGCDLGHVSGGTGMGSVHFRDTDYDDADVSSGMGRVSFD